MYPGLDTRIMFKSLFGKGKKQRTSQPVRPVLDDSVRNAEVGDEVAIFGLTEGFGDVYRTIERRDSFVVEQKNRYESDAGEWFEIIGEDGERRFWVEWAEEDELFVTATTEKKPMGVTSVGLTEEKLIQMDEENSIDNNFTYEGTCYYYKNSHEVTYYEDEEGDGEGFYLWDFVSEEEKRVLSVVKWEGVPFQVFISEVVPPGKISVSMAGTPGSRG